MCRLIACVCRGPEGCDRIERAALCSLRLHARASDEFEARETTEVNIAACTDFVGGHHLHGVEDMLDIRGNIGWTAGSLQMSPTCVEITNRNDTFSALADRCRGARNQARAGSSRMAFPGECTNVRGWASRPGSIARAPIFQRGSPPRSANCSSSRLRRPAVTGRQHGQGLNSNWGKGLENTGRVFWPLCIARVLENTGIQRKWAEHRG